MHSLHQKAQEAKETNQETNQSSETEHNIVGGSSQADRLMRNAAMDDSIGGSQGVTGLRVQ